MRGLAVLAAMGCHGAPAPEAPIQSRVPSRPRAAAEVCDLGDLSGANRNPTIAGLLPGPLAAALPIATPRWDRIWEELILDKDAPPNGAPVSSATVHYARAGSSRTAHLSVVDMIRICTCEPGTGAAMLAHDEAQIDNTITSWLTLAGRRVLETRGVHLRKLRTWVGDRCEVYVHAFADSSAAEIEDLLAAVDFAALERPCRAR